MTHNALVPEPPKPPSHNQAAVLRRLGALLDVVIREGASDLHLSVGRHPVVRVDGTLVPLMKQDVLTAQDTAAFALAMMVPEQEQQLKEGKDVDFAYHHTDGSRFRVNASIVQGAVVLALRYIPSKIPSLTELNLPNILETFTQKRQGFFLVVGPVGQGKSTTLASMINIINERQSSHIVTIEEPVEYIYPKGKSLIHQREVGIDTPSFYEALVSAFRQDVNVILVGEMRDKETIATAVSAAETGHLVFSTLHTNNAAQSIDRIIDSFPAGQQDQIRTQLAGSLLGIFSQRLLPRVSGGVIPAYELLINNTAVANLIRERRIHEINSVIETSMQQGMISFERSLAELTRNGEVTAEDALRASLNPDLLERFL